MYHQIPFLNIHQSFCGKSYCSINIYITLNHFENLGIQGRADNICI